jgi:hypothetical protein
MHGWPGRRRLWHFTINWLLLKTSGITGGRFNSNFSSEKVDSFTGIGISCRCLESTVQRNLRTRLENQNISKVFYAHGFGPGIKWRTQNTRN